MEQVWRATRRVFGDFHFVVVAVVLVLAAFALNWAVGSLKLHFRKLAVPLSQSLDTIPSKLGNWVCVAKQEQVDAELAESLGTDKFIFRTYVNSAVVPAAEVNDLTNLNAQQVNVKLGELRVSHPDAVMSLAVTYYTGKADTVAHIPERCELADGYEPTEPPATLVWEVNSTKTDGGKVSVRFINFEDRAGMSRVTKNVAYFFHANGQYQSNAIAVRMSLQDLWQKYAYYAKVELMTTCKDPDKAKAVMVDFLRSALPDIEKTYPQTSKYFAH